MTTRVFSVKDVDCPVCVGKAGDGCRTITGGTPTRWHAKRRQEARWRTRYASEYAEQGCRCSQPWTGIAPAYGRSAYAIKNGGTQHPLDPSDLCRCLKVSPRTPKHMRDRSPEWRVLVDHWDELAELLHEEHPNGRATKTYARMKELFQQARVAA